MTTNTRGPIRSNSKDPNSNPGEKKNKFTWKPARKEWHEDVKGLYNALKKSEHFDQFEETDMFQARLLAQLHSDAMFNTVEINAAHMKNLFNEWREFGTTLGTRKRLQLEVEKVKDGQAAQELLTNVMNSVITGKKVSGNGNS